MKLRICVYIIALISLIFHGCGKSSDKEEQSWLTEEPLTIPYKTRLQRYEKGNLVRNYSLEHGKIYKIDSLHASFSLDGWQLIGNAITWVDLSNRALFRSDEVYAGYRSIKIVRTAASQTDMQGSGIQSDFIKIIPGNYRFSFAARVENVLPQNPGVGIKMNDAIDIRLIYFDRNKNPIRPYYSYPIENQEIDVSYKALSFAHFRYIDSLSWNKIIGKSHAFPFPEGDIPTKARFVKIFIGLKGTGTLWIDDIDFRYTDKNFTVQERMNSYTDTSFITQNALIPAPKSIKKMESIWFLRPGMKSNQLPIILLSEKADETEKKAALLLQETLQITCDRYFGSNGMSKVKIVSNHLQGEIKESSLVFIIGNTGLLQNEIPDFPKQTITKYPDGYFIYAPDEAPHHIFIGANQSNGIYYGALTVVQLFDRKEPVFHNARIVDYPDFSLRFYALEAGKKVNPNLVDELIRYKFNGLLLLTDSTVNKEIKAINSIGLLQYVSASGYQLPLDSVLIYPYPLYYETHSNPLSGFSFPQFFNNQMMNNSDIPDRPEITDHDSYIYTGSSYFSVNTDAADISRFSSLYGSLPVFMDNSMRMATKWGRFNGNDPYYPGKVRLFNLFEPYANEDIRACFSMLDSSCFIINLPANSEIEIIRLATASEFIWNNSSYSKDEALWKVLVSRYGIENSRKLIEYADAYALLLEVLAKLDRNVQMARNIKYGQQYITNLTAILAKISDDLGLHHPLVKDLQKLNAQLRLELNKNQTIIPVKK